MSSDKCKEDRCPPNGPIGKDVMGFYRYSWHPRWILDKHASIMGCTEHPRTIPHLEVEQEAQVSHPWGFGCSKVENYIELVKLTVKI